MSDGRFNPEGRKYQIQKIWDLHQEIMRFLLLGHTHVDIAKQLDITEATVSNVANSALVKERLAVMRGARDAEVLDLSVEIKRFAPEALELLQNLMRDSNTGIKHRIQIAIDAMDRAGYAPPKIIEAKHLHAYFTATEIEDMKKRAHESGQVIDAQCS